MKPGLREKVERTLLDSYAPPCVVVDAEHQIVYSSGPIGHYLDAQPVTLSRNVIDVAPRDLVGPLRGVLTRLAAEPERIVRQTVFVGESGTRRSIDLVARTLNHGGAAGLYLIVVEDRDPPAAIAEMEPDAAGAVSAESSGAPSRVESKAEAVARAGRVLVIEDHLDAAEGMRLLLELKGYHVTVAHDGRAGIEKARQFQPGIVLCDIGLPGGMDGYAVARAFRGEPEFKSVALVALTGYGQEKDQALAVEAGFDAHMTKPADPAALIRLMETLPRRT